MLTTSLTPNNKFQKQWRQFRSGIYICNRYLATVLQASRRITKCTSLHSD